MTDDLVKRVDSLMVLLNMERKKSLSLGKHIEKLEAALNCNLPDYDPEIGIVERLRQLGNWRVDGTKSSPIYNKSADRIEKLEAALQDIIDERGICGHCGQLATGEGKRSFVICDKAVLGFKGPCHWTPQDPKYIARKALGGKDDPQTDL